MSFDASRVVRIESLGIKVLNDYCSFNSQAFDCSIPNLEDVVAVPPDDLPGSFAFHILYGSGACDPVVSNRSITVC